jgi:hypothetical protein
MVTTTDFIKGIIVNLHTLHALSHLQRGISLTQFVRASSSLFLAAGKDPLVARSTHLTFIVLVLVAAVAVCFGFLNLSLLNEKTTKTHKHHWLIKQSPNLPVVSGVELRARIATKPAQVTGVGQLNTKIVMCSKAVIYIKDGIFPWSNGRF